MHGDNDRAPGQGRLGGILCRNVKPAHSLLFGGKGHGKHTGNTAKLTVQAHFPQKGVAGLRLLYLPRGGKNAQKNGQIVVGARFFLAGRGQVYGDPAHGKPESAALHRRPDPLPCLLHRRVRQADNIKARKAVGNETLRHHTVSADTGDAQGADAANHSFLSRLSFFPFCPRRTAHGAIF